jgi:hypothetical protein
MAGTAARGRIAVAVFSLRGEENMLEWQPRLRLICLIVLVVLVSAALFAGLGDFDIIDNWEW